MASYAHILLDSLKWPYLTPKDRPSVARFVLSTLAGDIQFSAEGLEDSKIVIIYLIFGIEVPTERRQEVALLLARINNCIAMGSWCIDLNSGAIWYKMTMYGETKDDAYLFDCFVQGGLRIFSEWQKTISVVISTELVAEKAFFIKHLLPESESAAAISNLEGRYRP